MGYTCITEDCFNPVENQDLGLCASCNSDRRKAEKLERKTNQKRSQLIENQKIKGSHPRPKPKQVSDKRKIENDEYTRLRLEFLNNLTNKQCPVLPGYIVSQIHHKKGRRGYADKWAKDNNIPLLLDTRFWLAVSHAGHAFIENNPQTAKDNGLRDLFQCIEASNLNSLNM